LTSLLKTIKNKFGILPGKTVSKKRRHSAQKDANFEIGEKVSLVGKTPNCEDKNEIAKT
jgi:hypothetical protein